MRKFLLTVCFGLLPGILTAAPRAQHVFIISFDQATPDGIKKSKMPMFQKMAKEGAHSWEAYTIVPSITLPSHTSMLTGVGIQKHQIDWNNYDIKRGVVKVPTVFKIAKEKSKALKTGMFVTKEKFRHLLQPDTVDVFVSPEDNGDISAAKAFAKSMAKEKFNLAFIHFGGPDVAGHAFGVNSKEKMKAYADADEGLRIVREAVKAAGVEDSSVFILTADHGGHDVKDKNGKTRGTHGTSNPDDVIIPWVAWGAAVKPGFEITAPVIQYDTAATALWLLDIPVPEGFWGRPVKSAFK